MPNRLRKFVSSVPVITFVVLLALYLVGGFLALPAVIKWQLEKQVPQQLGHRISVGDVRFNPLLFKFEIGDLALSDPDGRPMLGFKRLRADFELRSVIDRAWTFAAATLEAPVLHLVLTDDGRHNYSALAGHLRGSEAPARNSDPLPKIVVKRVALTDGRIEYSDRLLAEPLVAQIETLQIEIDDLSTFAAQAAHYRLSLRTSAGGALDVGGDFGLNPLAAKGTLKLSGLDVATLVRGLSRLVALEVSAGMIGLGASFDLAVNRYGVVSGTLQDIAVDAAKVSVAAAGASSPLLEMETLSLKEGRVDLEQRQVAFSQLLIAKGRVAASADAKGSIDWARIVRTPPASTQQTPAPTVQSPAAPVQGGAAAALPQPWRVAVASTKVADIALSYSDASRGRSANVAAVGIDLAATAVFGPAGMRVELVQPKMTIAGARMAEGADALELPGVRIDAGSLTIAAADRQFELKLDAPRVSVPDGVTAKQGDSSLALRAFSVESGAIAFAGEVLSIAQAGTELRMVAAAPAVKLSGFAARREGERAAIDELSFEGAEVKLTTAGSGRLDVVLGGIRSAAGALALHRGDDGIDLRTATLGGESISLALADGRFRVAGSGARAAASGIAARQASDRIALADASFDVKSMSVSAGGEAPGPTGLEARIEGAALRLATLGIVAQGATSEVLRVAAMAAAPPADADAATTAPSAPGAGAASATPAPAWRLALKAAELDGFSVGFEDRRATPPLGVGLDAIRVRIADLDTTSSSPMQVEVEATLASGGEIGTRGSVRLDDGPSELQIKLAGIALAPVQRYLSEFALLQLATGTVSTDGRLRYRGGAGSGPLLAYEGGIAVDRLLLEEVGPKRPFLGWDALASDDVVLNLEPNRLDIGELRLDRLSGRLIIAEDLTMNVTDVLKKSDKPAGAPAPQSKPAEDRFPVTIARLRVNDGTLEFADLSLRPQFATRMHELKGVISGLGTDVNGSAQLQLDALVDKYGSAKIGGEISVHHPGKFTEIDMAFRNLEMTSLSPYVAKFAGYKIAAGRLALDLQYKIRDGKLVGTNKIVLNQVELGEKVVSPTALDLPLELALAILRDSNGVIDIGLPVSGDLNDPKFDYGAVIGKALGNLFGKLVTAPFAALGAMFGGGEKKLDSVAFEPGSATITPQEREKLEAVARALKSRPKLRLVVPPTYAAAKDAAVLQSRAVRADIVKRMGGELKAGEDPGPIDAANPRVQRAIEASFSERNSPVALAALKRRAMPAAVAAKPPPAPPPEFYEGLVTWLIGEAVVTEPMLAQLAARRGEAIVREVTTSGGVPAARVSLGDVRKSTADEGKAVTLHLELGVAK